MNEYIFYTTEGFTAAPKEGAEVSNCQVLGRATGIDEEEAQKTLLRENPWILETGYNPAEFIIQQVLTDTQRADMKSIISYFWKEAERSYKASEDKEHHIFNAMNRISKI